MASAEATLYFDHNATTPVAPEVLSAMLPYLGGEYGNASSIYLLGQRARAAMERARVQLAALLHCQPTEVVFTGGGTESDNMAIQGVVRSHLGSPASRHGLQRHVITSAIEHPAVLYTCRALQREGVEVTFLPVGRDGFVDPGDVRRALRPETVLITIMHANNEVGTVQPIAEIAAIAREAGVLLHTDAVQSTGKIPLDVKALGVDLLTMSAHKIYGPKGVGALYIRKGVELKPVMSGGHGEHNPRPGTDNMPGIVGLGAAAEMAANNMASDGPRIAALRDRLERGILERLDSTGVNGPEAGCKDGRYLRVPNTTNMYFDFIEGESLVIALDLEGISCSTGSACSSGSVEASHVLTAMGLANDRAHSSLRLSLGRQNDDRQVDQFIETISRVVARLRAMSPQAPVQAR